MKNLISKIIVILSIMCFIFGCGLTKRNHNGDNVILGTSMRDSYVMYNATLYQIDSICKADTLPSISHWRGTTFVDYETKEVIVKRIYMKTDGRNETFYIILGDKEPYKVERRITE